MQLRYTAEKRNKSSMEMKPQRYLDLRDQVLLGQIQFLRNLDSIFFQNLFAAGINAFAD